MLVLLLGFGFSALITLFVFRTADVSRHWGDLELSAPQRVHADPVPRIGGVGLVLGLITALVAWWGLRGEGALLGLQLIACSAPAFLAGLAEDLTRCQPPRRRLFFTALSAGLAVLALGAVIRRTDIPGLDWVVSFAVPAAMVTVFAVAGVANAINIIDGFNGLASMCVVMMLSAIAYVAFRAHDPLIATCALAGVGAVMGFFIWNFPAGLVFLGDGGAYFLGFFVAELSILLLQRHGDEVSPLFPLLVCIYPILETVFSIYRRWFLRAQPPTTPDGIHLHSLIYRRVTPRPIGYRMAPSGVRRNSMSSPYLWMLCMSSVVPAVIFWNNTRVLAVCLLLFTAGYISLYWRIVRFKSPRWLVSRR